MFKPTIECQTRKEVDLIKWFSIASLVEFPTLISSISNQPWFLATTQEQPVQKIKTYLQISNIINKLKYADKVNARRFKPQNILTGLCGWPFRHAQEHIHSNVDSDCTLKRRRWSILSFTPVYCYSVIHPSSINRWQCLSDVVNLSMQAS